MSRKSEILAELARSRAAIARDASVVRSHWDLAARARNAFQARPFAWLGGAAAVGYLFAGRRPRTKEAPKLARGNLKGPVKAEAGKTRVFRDILFPLLRLAVPLLRPAVSAYAAKRFADFAAKLGKP
ncbi:MAG: hypothetical protein WCS31_05545 [Verrucomicrobiae bacterium]